LARPFFSFRKQSATTVSSAQLSFKLTIPRVVFFGTHHQPHSSKEGLDHFVPHF
jgi:hypothetical protein